MSNGMKSQVSFEQKLRMLDTRNSRQDNQQHGPQGNQATRPLFITDGPEDVFGENTSGQAMQSTKKPAKSAIAAAWDESDDEELARFSKKLSERELAQHAPQPGKRKQTLRREVGGGTPQRIAETSPTRGLTTHNVRPGPTLKQKRKAAKHRYWRTKTINVVNRLRTMPPEYDVATHACESGARQDRALAELRRRMGI